MAGSEFTYRTRCRPGDRAQIIASNNRTNVGKVVAVVRQYSQGELVSGGTNWCFEGVGWVVVSLGEPIATTDGSRVVSTSAAVVCDKRLRPLRDDETGFERAITRPKSKRKIKDAA